VDAWEEVRVALHVPTFSGDISSPCELHAQSMGVLGVTCERCSSLAGCRPDQSQCNRFLLASPPTAAAASAASDPPSATWRIEAVVFEALLHQLGVAPHLHLPQQTARKLPPGADFECTSRWTHADVSNQVRGHAKRGGCVADVVSRSRDRRESSKTKEEFAGMRKPGASAFRVGSISD